MARLKYKWINVFLRADTSIVKLTAKLEGEIIKGLRGSLRVGFGEKGIELGELGHLAKEPFRFIKTHISFRTIDTGISVED